MIDISLFSNHSPSEWFSEYKNIPRPGFLPGGGCFVQVQAAAAAGSSGVCVRIFLRRMRKQTRCTAAVSPQDTG